jgi:hypothetical protein
MKDHTSPVNNPVGLFYSTITVYNYFGMAKERVRLIYPENPIWVNGSVMNGKKKGPVIILMVGLVRSDHQRYG